MALVRKVALSAYYVIYFTLQKWINPFCIFCFWAAGILGWRKAKKNSKRFMGWKLLLFSGIVIMLGMLILESGGKVTEPGIFGSILQLFYYVSMCLFWFAAGGRIRTGLTDEKNEDSEASSVLWKYMKKILAFLYFAGLVPMIFLCPYIFPKADDYSFGYHAHIAWEHTGSLWEVIRAAFVMIREAWFDWQGTYSSIFLMSLQPAVFSERLYAVVPFLFIGMITAASWFFMKTILVDVLKIERKFFWICLWAYLLFVIQCMPDSGSAFIWYNGAIHYIASHCALLCTIAFVIRGTFIKKTTNDTTAGREACGPGAWIGAAIFAVYTGGGNYVTAVGATFICLTVFLGVALTKEWKKYKGMLGICVLYFAALVINLMAPGNFNKKASVEGYNMAAAFVLAFVRSLDHMLGKWMSWAMAAFILLMIPVLWNAAKQTKYKYRYPGLVLGYSWCYMASLFFAPLYTVSTVEIGRFQNVMFLQWILLLMFDLTYIMGWLQRKYGLQAKGMSLKAKKYYFTGIFAAAFLCMGLSMKAEPEKYTVFNTLRTLSDPGLKTYEQEYWKMVDVLEGEEKVVEIQDFSYIPSYLDIPLRHEGLRLFYDKEQVIVEE